MCSPWSAILRSAQGQVQHDMQSFSNQSVKPLIKMMTWGHRDCSRGSFCTELITSLPLRLKVSTRGYWHFYISRLIDGRELLNPRRMWVLMKRGPFLNAGQLRAQPTISSAKCQRRNDSSSTTTTFTAIIYNTVLLEGWGRGHLEKAVGYEIEFAGIEKGAGHVPYWL